MKPACNTVTDFSWITLIAIKLNHQPTLSSRLYGKPDNKYIPIEEQMTI